MKNGNIEQVIHNTGNINKIIQIMSRFISVLFITIALAIKNGIKTILKNPNKILNINNTIVIYLFS